MFHAQAGSITVALSSITVTRCFHAYAQSSQRCNAFEHVEETTKFKENFSSQRSFSPLQFLRKSAQCCLFLVTYLNREVYRQNGTWWSKQNTAFSQRCLRLTLQSIGTQGCQDKDNMYGGGEEGVTSSHTTSVGHLKWPGMRTAIVLAQYFALCSFLLSWLVSLEQCWSTPPVLVSCEVVSCRMKGC